MDRVTEESISGHWMMALDGGFAFLLPLDRVTGVLDPLWMGRLTGEALSGRWRMALAVMLSLVAVVASISLPALDRVTGVLKPFWMGAVTEDAFPGRGTRTMGDMLLLEVFPWLGADVEFWGPSVMPLFGSFMVLRGSERPLTALELMVVVFLLVVGEGTGISRGLRLLSGAATAFLRPGSVREMLG